MVFKRENLDVMPNLTGNRWYPRAQYPYIVRHWYNASSFRTHRNMRCEVVAWCKTQRQAERRLDELARGE